MSFDLLLAESLTSECIGWQQRFLSINQQLFLSCVVDKENDYISNFYQLILQEYHRIAELLYQRIAFLERKAK